MRVSRIEFNGYRRLAKTATGIDGPLTAFIGFNEAGKTTVLRGLRWFTHGGQVSPVDHNRSRPPASDHSAVVKVFYELDDDDKNAFADIAMDNQPTTLVLYKKRDGNRIRSLSPRPTRPAKPFELVRGRLAKATTKLAAQFAAAADEDEQDPNDWAATVSEALSSPDEEWPPQWLSAVQSLAAWLKETPAGRKQPRDVRLAQMLDDLSEHLTEEHPSEAVWNAIADRVPDFVLFEDEDRALETSYNLQPENRAISPAVARLLTLAGIDLDEMWSHIQTSDSTKRETTLERGNDRLRKLFDQAWNQSKVTVRFNVNGTLLEVLLKELHGNGDVTNIAERSDGLKTFVALVAFLASGGHTVPPVLLIDEAETHLHYDAQADLVSVLLKSVNAAQVFYTTHSPGCLPSDLGTGIRVLARDPEYADASVIKNNFWEGEGPGFSPLLFAMGAGAAAFSMCRNAVLAEGASDMVLLPTLIRKATRLDDLDYQVAPGLANAHGSGIRVEEVAAKVVYLTDGDRGGDEHKAALKAVGVDGSRIYSLPTAHAVEDLINREDYVTVVNKFLDTMGQVKRFTAADVPDGVPIAKAFADWAKRKKVRTPSKVEMAYALVRADVRLTQSGKRTLVGLHDKFTDAFMAGSK
ncbi:putative ATP-dependent endonuclease of OLD family [Nocardioides aromaticivorans]|uniref:Putative ATP-dependent endonuclease of OLD family n=1 Tax=Nocardioides aromaticivorans TaxID=200618 RepID=A0A7Z0CMC9_9ACTN|nr:AAA family ATPase [Nocardioides aromaticivorans]NYI46184.1 putative ATP-dependent endonuclease of OLD family [Nocardioides aromaticivorans]